MSSITQLLWIKIIGTAVFAAIPMIAIPESLYLQLGYPEQPTMLFLRLYGFSTLALLVGYYGGIESCRRGVFPSSVLRMGLVSNGTQGLALLVAGALGIYSDWGPIAQAMIWGMTAFICGLAVVIGYRFFTQRDLSAVV